MTDRVLTEAEVAEIEARADHAMPAPWFAHSDMGERFIDRGEDHDEEMVATFHGDVPMTDVNFLAHARTDIPALIASHRALAVENARLLSSHHGCSECGNDVGIPTGRAGLCLDHAEELANENARLRAVLEVAQALPVCHDIGCALHEAAKNVRVAAHDAARECPYKAECDRKGEHVAPNCPTQQAQEADRGTT